MWLLGLFTIFIGASAHIVALMLAPVTVVQPVGILAVPWAALMAARIHRHTVTRPMWGAVAMTIAGIVLFRPSCRPPPPLEHTVLDPTAIAIGCGVIVVIGTTPGLLGWKGPVRARLPDVGLRRFVLLRLVGGMVKATSEVMKQDSFHGSPVFWIVAPFLLDLVRRGRLHGAAGAGQRPGRDHRRPG